MNLKNKFQRNGYVVVPNVLNINDIRLIKDISSKIFGRKYKNSARWSSVDFNKYLAKLRKKNPKNFSYLYNTLQSNINLKKIASNKKITTTIEKILGIKEHNISHSICTMRIDSFIDERNSYGWHQERSYYPMNEDGNGVFIWIALMDISKELGPLHIMKESHKEGFIKPITTKKNNSSTQHLIPKKIINKYQNNLETFEIKKGDAIFVNMNSFHRSGKNISNKFRLSIVARYHDNSKDDFRPFTTQEL